MEKHFFMIIIERKGKLWQGEGAGSYWFHWGRALRMALTSSATAVRANSNWSWEQEAIHVRTENYLSHVTWGRCVRTKWYNIRTSWIKLLGSVIILCVSNLEFSNIIKNLCCNLIFHPITPSFYLSVTSGGDTAPSLSSGYWLQVGFEP